MSERRAHWLTVHWFQVISQWASKFSLSCPSPITEDTKIAAMKMLILRVQSRTSETSGWHRGGSMNLSLCFKIFDSVERCCIHQCHCHHQRQKGQDCDILTLCSAPTMSSFVRIQPVELHVQSTPLQQSNLTDIKEYIYFQKLQDPWIIFT